MVQRKRSHTQQQISFIDVNMTSNDFGVYLCAVCEWLKVKMLIGGAEGDRTPSLRIASGTLLSD